MIFMRRGYILAIECSLKLERAILTKEIILNQLAEMGVTCTEVTNLPKGFRVDEIINILGFSLSLIDTSSNPFGYESKFLSHDFYYKQNLNLRLGNDYDSVKAITNILFLVFSIIDLTNGNVLFLFNDNECLYRINGVLSINNDDGFWDREDYKLFITNREYKLV